MLASNFLLTKTNHNSNIDNKIYSNNFRYILAFTIPIILMAIYFVYRGVYPFGNSTILNIDLGQQYVDFLAWAKNTILYHREQIFYSFNKSLGGDMVSVWAYYLFSPFNLLLLLFPQPQIPLGIAVITLLRYGLMGLSFSFLLSKITNLPDFLNVAYAVSYSFSGWALANQTNIIWSDVLIELPILVWSIILLFKKKTILYPIILTVSLLDNFYMGYMLCIFSVLIFLSLLFLNLKSKKKLHYTSLFIGYSLLGGGLSAFLLVPTFLSMMGSKASYTGHMILTWELYNPFNILSKLSIGAFNFEQYSNGLSNIYVPSFFIITALMIFFSKKFTKKEKLIAFLLPAIIYISFLSVTLNLIWHAFQFPIWYNYRFSYLFSFLILLISALFLNRTWGQKIKIKSFILPIFFTGFLLDFLRLNRTYYTFLSNRKILLTTVCYILSLFILLLYHRVFQKKTNSIDYNTFFELIISLFIILECSCNIYYTFQDSEYLSFDNYQNYVITLNKYISKIKTDDHDFYRIEKSFMRSKNDSMQASYNGITHFDSMYEAEIPTFIGNIGNPKTSVNALYTNPTLLTDSLLGIKYYLTPNTYHGQNYSNSPENIKYPFILRDDVDKNYIRQSLFNDDDQYIKVYKNPFALNLGYAVHPKVLKINNNKNNKSDPVLYQTKILSLMANKKNGLGETVHWTNANMYNIKYVKMSHHQRSFQRIDPNIEAYVDYSFTPKNNNSYYVILPGGINNISTFSLNHRPLRQYGDFQNNVIIILGTKAKGKKLTFRTTLKSGNNNIAPLKLLQIKDNQTQNSLKNLAKNQLKISYFSPTHIQGTINIPKNKQYLFTTIPYSKGWQAFVDKKKVKTQLVLDTFEGLPLPKGAHKIEFKYHVPGSYLGIIITFLSLIFLLFNIISFHRCSKIQLF